MIFLVVTGSWLWFTTSHYCIVNGKCSLSKHSCHVILGGCNVVDGYILLCTSDHTISIPSTLYCTHSDFHIVGFRAPICMIDSIIWGSEDSLYCTPSSREQEAELTRRRV